MSSYSPKSEENKTHHLSTVPNDPPPSYVDAIAGLEVHDGRIDLDALNLCHQLESLASRVQDDNPASSDNASAVQDNETTAVPRFNIVLQAVGSREDIQPFVALGKSLQAHGHRVRLATHPGFQTLVETHGLEFFSVGGNPSELVASNGKELGLIPRMSASRRKEVSRRRQMMAGVFQACWRSCIDPGNGLDPTPPEKHADGAGITRAPFVIDAIIANPSSFAHIHCAEKLGIPVHIMFTMPWSPTSTFEHPLANIKHGPSYSERQLANRLSYYVVDALAWQGLGDLINRFRHKTLDLDLINPMRVAGLLHSLRIPHSYCWSPAVLPKPTDWPSEISVVGYSFLPPNVQYNPPQHVADFLSNGPQPIYIGFESVEDPLRLIEIVFQAVRYTGQRAIISGKWIGTDVTPAVNTLLIDDCPYEYLFARVACAVHHGSAAATAASLAAGCPTVVVPFSGDQPFWGLKIHQAGAGPLPLPHQGLTAEKLANAILAAMHPSVRAKVQSIADIIAQEDGATKAMHNFHAHLPLESWRCAIDENRVAVWYSRKHKMRLSALAATVLVQENQIDPGSLTRFRVCSKNLSQGPWEPFSGAAYAVVDLFYDAFRGMGEMLADVVLTPQKTTRVATEKIKKEKGGQQPSSPPEYSPQPLPKVSSISKVPGGMFVRGTGRIVKAAARAPGEFTLAMAQGAHNAPRLWGDSTVRQLPKVSGFGSGLAAGASELCLDIYDGISGLVVQPVREAQERGPIGIATGIGKGVIGMPVKFWSGANAIVGYPLKGADKSITSLFNNTEQNIKKARMEQGVREASLIDSAERQAIVEKWQSLTSH